MSAAKPFKCTSCVKRYCFKGGLLAHVKRNHVETLVPKRVPAKTKALKPASNVIPVVTAKPATPNQIKKTVWKISNLTTQEVDNLLEDEEESNVHIDEAEYNIGINQCAVDWLGVNFGSLFSNSGEFSGR